jgi:hypothetical protein
MLRKIAPTMRLYRQEDARTACLWWLVEWMGWGRVLGLVGWVVGWLGGWVLSL